MYVWADRGGAARLDLGVLGGDEGRERVAAMLGWMLTAVGGPVDVPRGLDATGELAVVESALSRSRYRFIFFRRPRVMALAKFSKLANLCNRLLRRSVACFYAVGFGRHRL